MPFLPESIPRSPQSRTITPWGYLQGVPVPTVHFGGAACLPRWNVSSGDKTRVSSTPSPWLPAGLPVAHNKCYRLK